MVTYANSSFDDFDGILIELDNDILRAESSNQMKKEFFKCSMYRHILFALPRKDLTLHHILLHQIISTVQDIENISKGIY